MGSFTDKGIVDQIIERNGEHDETNGESRQFDYVKVVEYTTPEGQKTWGAVLRLEVARGMGDRYDNPTPYIRGPKIIWTRTETP